MKKKINIKNRLYFRNRYSSINDNPILNEEFTILKKGYKKNI